MGIALCSLACLGIVLFTFVGFTNDWSGWRQYEGQRYRRTDFQVARAYFKKEKGGPYIYASGLVDGQREWMSLHPYLRPPPRDEAELNARVPAGTSIPIYFFPDMKGQSRVRVFEKIPPAEAYRRSAMRTLSHGVLALTMDATLFGALLIIRRARFS